MKTNEHVKIKPNSKAALAEILMTMVSKRRDHRRVIERITRAAMIVLWLLLGTTLQPQCKDANPKAPEAPIQPNPNLSFRGIGDLPGGGFHSEALGISDDGQVILGRSSSASFEQEGFRVTARDSLLALQVLQGPAGAPVSSEPRALTPDGEIIAGKIASARGPAEAARWTAATGWVGLGDLAGGTFASQALGISADGAVIVGWGSSQAGFVSAQWVNGNVFAIGDLPGGQHGGAAALVSDDGRTIVGTGYSALGPEAFVWRESTGMIGLGDLSGGQFSSEPFGMTPDASIIVGEATSTQGIEAFYWTQSGGMVGLGDLPGGTFHSIAFDVSAEGTIVVGFGNTAVGSEAFIWDATHGMRNLKSVLVSAGMRDVEVWRLTEATGISADGKMIVGNGTNPSGQTEGWIAELPE